MPNNGMHPTANSVAFMRETWRIGVECAAGDAGRSTAQKSPRLNLMTNDPKRRSRPSKLILIVPPLLFVVKDFIATQIVLSYEPGITEKAVNTYALQLLPGTLFVVTGNAPILNVGFGIFIGAFLYLFAFYVRRRRVRAAAEQALGADSP